MAVLISSSGLLELVVRNVLAPRQVSLANRSGYQGVAEKRSRSH